MQNEIERIAGVFRQYDLQGFHRTGSDVDAESARWLAGEVEALGLEPILTPVPLERIDPVEAGLHVGPRFIDGLPLFDCSYTSPAGVEGCLGPLAGAGGIGVGKLAFGGLDARELQQARVGGAQRGLVLVCEEVGADVAPGVTPLNADRFLAPFGPPVLQVSRDVAGDLFEAAGARAEARLVCRIERTPVEALNVGARIGGSESGLRPLVVITPRSGWWHCASERGGGLACWLEMMRVLAGSRPRRDVCFLASTGHELGHLGLELFLRENDGLGKDALWIHLGANFAAALSPAVRLQASDAQLRELALAALRETPPDQETALGSAPLGEARNIFAAGGRYVSLLGSNGLFHHPDDRWPGAVDVSKTARIARAFCELGVRLSQEGER